MSKIYNKLVRDNIPQIMLQNGAEPVTRILNDEEYFQELNKKLTEEVAEYLENYDIVEIADIIEVLRAILELKGISYDDFEDIRKEKVRTKGAFKNKIYLEKEK